MSEKSLICPIFVVYSLYKNKQDLMETLCLLDVELHALLPLVALEGDDVHEVVAGHLHLLIPKQNIWFKIQFLFWV